MTAADGSRLAQLEPGLWVDLDEVVAVETSVGMLQERRVTITTRQGAVFDVVVGAKPGTGNPRTDEQKDEELDYWLLNYLGDLLEGVDSTNYPRDRS